MILGDFLEILTTKTNVLVRFNQDGDVLYFGNLRGIYKGLFRFNIKKVRPSNEKDYIDIVVYDSLEYHKLHDRDKPRAIDLYNMNLADMELAKEFEGSNVQIRLIDDKGNANIINNKPDNLRNIKQFINSEWKVRTLASNPGYIKVDVYIDNE